MEVVAGHPSSETVLSAIASRSTARGPSLGWARSQQVLTREEVGDGIMNTHEYAEPCPTSPARSGEWP